MEAPRDVDINDWFPNINKKSILNFTQLFVPTNSLPDEKKRNILKGSKPIKTTPLDRNKFIPCAIRLENAKVAGYR